ncbi:hypothetical protein PENSPDRAFT_507109 [Peniophora sp. CONT]|nr:hypothetical protein PENSPDRAFT_507109 [Peniophora sp. CONT]
MSSTLPSTRLTSEDPSPSPASTTTKRATVRISAAARQLLFEHFTNTSTHPHLNARKILAENVSRIDNIQYTPEQVNNWFAHRRTTLNRNRPDGNTSAVVIPVETPKPLDTEVLQALDTLFTRTPSASNTDVARWCRDLRIPLSQGLQCIEQMRARHSLMQATSLPTPSSSASPEFHARELPGQKRIEQETRPEALPDTKGYEKQSTTPCLWLDELAARPMVSGQLEIVQYPKSSSIPSTLSELEDSLAEFRTAMSRLHVEHPDDDTVLGDSG